MRLLAAVTSIALVFAAGCGRSEPAKAPLPAAPAAVAAPAPAPEPVPEIPAIVLVGDDSPEFPFHKLLPGMHRRDVLANCGAPQRTRMQDGKEELEYHRSGIEPGLVYRVVMHGEVIERVIRSHGIPGLMHARRGGIESDREVAAISGGSGALTPPKGSGVIGSEPAPAAPAAPVAPSATGR